MTVIHGVDSQNTMEETLFNMGTINNLIVCHLKPWITTIDKI